MNRKQRATTKLSSIPYTDSNKLIELGLHPVVNDHSRSAAGDWDLYRFRARRKEIMSTPCDICSGTQDVKVWDGVARCKECRSLLRSLNNGKLGV